MLNRIKAEPVLVSSLVFAVLGLLLAFGVDLSEKQVAAIMGVVGAVLAIVTRSKVTPAE